MEKVNDDFKPLERYRIEGNVVVIELAVEEPFDIYDDKDPSPLRMRDFKKEVEIYITESIKEIPDSKKIKFIFYFDKFSNETLEREQLIKSYYDFFKFEIKVKSFKVKEKIIHGLKALAVGLSFLFFCILITALMKDKTNSIFSDFFIEGLTVLGWVSLWNPIQVFLYEIWPLREFVTILRRAYRAEVDFRSVEHLPEPRKYI